MNVIYLTKSETLFIGLARSTLQMNYFGLRVVFFLRTHFVQQAQCFLKNHRFEPKMFLGCLLNFRNHIA